jgi:hypothetical protein
MLKNPCKATGFYYDSHDCNLKARYFGKRLGLVMLKGYEACPPQADKLAGLFQHICLPYQKQVLQHSSPF